MLVSEAEELVDIYGADKSRWPDEHKADLESVLNSSPSFRDYVAACARLDGLLEEWEEDDEGTTRGDAGGDKGDQPDEDDEPNRDSDGDPDEDDDEDSDGDPDEDEGEGEPEEDDGEDQGEEHGPEDEGDDPPQDPTIVETDETLEQPDESGMEPGMGTGAGLDLDLEDLKDTDEAVAMVLRGMLFNGFDDTTQTHFTRDYDTVKPYQAPPHVDITKFEAEVKRHSGALQKGLERIMKAKSLSYFTPGFRSGRINGPSLHRLAAGDDRIFRRRHVAETNKVAVSLVCDLSGSMSGAKVKTALMAAWAFSEVLDRLRIPNEVCGFTTGEFPPGFDYAKHQNELTDFYDATGLKYGSVRVTPLWQPIFKAYEEKFSPEVKRRMTHMATEQNGMGSNNDAAAIEYAGDRLRRRPETRKIMIVFSDGQPADGGVDYRILHNSVRVNVKKLEAQGMEVIGVGIQDDSVRHYYKCWHKIDKVSELPRFVMNELRVLLTQAG